ncbi:unnamed protein product, partial [Rhizoctonia solani]
YQGILNKTQREIPPNLLIPLLFMPIRRRFQKLKLAVKSWWYRSPTTSPTSSFSYDIETESDSSHPRPSSRVPLPAPSLEIDPGNWPHLQLLHQTLFRHDGYQWWGPQALREAVSTFAKSINGFKHHESEVLLGEFEVLFEELHRACDKNAPPAMTGAIAGLCWSVTRELSYAKRKQGESYSKLGKFDNDILLSYHRIKNYFQRITSNIEAGYAETTDKEPLSSYRLSVLSSRYYSEYNREVKRGPCAQGTRVGVLNQIRYWINNTNTGPVYWINGMIGTGKTTIAYSLCKDLENSHKLAASFFCSRSLPECRDSRQVIPSIAYQLSDFSGPFRSALLRVTKSPAALPLDPESQFDYLISKPLLEVKHTLPGILVVVIDALDDCVDKEGTSQLLDVLLSKTSNLDLQLKFVISSRPEPQIRSPMAIQREKETARVVLHELDRQIVRAEIERYVRTSIKWQGTGQDPRPALIQQSDAWFAYAAVTIQHLSRSHRSFHRGLYVQATLTDLQLDESKLTTLTRSQIDNLYATELGIALKGQSSGWHKIRQVLYLVLCTQTGEPLKVSTISMRLKMKIDCVWATLDSLWSVLSISKDRGTVTTLHSSFSEYMLDISRSGSYCCDPTTYTQTMAYRSFQIFRQMEPQFNICGLESSHVPDSSVDGLKEQVKRVISVDLFDAAQQWVIHLLSAPMGVLHELLLDLEEFFSVRLLLWMEVMNLKGCAHTMPEAIWKVMEWAKSRVVSNIISLYWNNAQAWIQDSEELKELLHDAWLFTSVFALGEVSNSTPHIYVSMLPLWPEPSPISKYYSRNIQHIIKVEGTAANQRQYTPLAIWQFSGVTNSAVYSPDGIYIAMGVGQDVQLLFALTGCMVFPPFQGHEDLVLSVRFSPDGTRIVSGSLDKTVRVWSTQNGRTVVGPILGHTGNVNSVDFSPDGTLIASGCHDGSIHIYSSCNGENRLGPLMEHGPVTEIKFSPDGNWIAICSWHGVVIRNLKDGQILKSFLPEGKNVPFRSLDISPDGTRIAAGSINDSVHIWDIDSGQVLLGPLNSADATNYPEPNTSVSFSPDGAYLISSSPGRNICLWEVRSSNLPRILLEGHTDSITSVRFSPNGAYIVSGSRDKTIRQWDVRNIPKKLNLLPGHSSSVMSVSFSPDGAFIISGSADGTICVWNSESGERLHIPLMGGYNSRVLTTYSPNGRYILLAADSKSIIMLDSKTGNIALGPIRFHQPIQSTMFSPDGSRIIVGSTNNHLKVLAANTGDMIMEIHPQVATHSDWLTALVPSPDGVCFAVGSLRSGINIYDAQTGTLLNSPAPFEEYISSPRSLSFSPDSTCIAYGSFSRVLVRNAQTGRLVLRPLEVQKAWVNCIEYSPDGTLIVSGTTNGAIYVWDTQTGALVLGPVELHTASIRSVGFSIDGTRVVSGSDDKTIQVTDIRKEFQYPPGSLTAIGSDWELNTSGWIIDKQGQLVIWVPPEMRSLLMRPRSKLLLSKKGWFRLKFGDTRLGKAWSEYYKPESSDQGWVES